jgi:hypothetical protein
LQSIFEVHVVLALTVEEGWGEETIEEAFKQGEL